MFDIKIQLIKCAQDIINILFFSVSILFSVRSLVLFCYVFCLVSALIYNHCTKNIAIVIALGTHVHVLESCSPPIITSK